MAVQLNTQTSDDAVVIKTSSFSTFNRSNRVKSDLDKKFIEEDVKARASYLGLGYVDLYGIPIDTTHLIFLDKQRTINSQIGVFRIDNKEIYLATPNPNFDGQQAIINEFKNQGFTIKVFLCSDSSFQKILKIYDTLILNQEVDENIVLLSSDLDPTKAEKINLQNIQAHFSGVSISKIIQLILIAALQHKASDIHMDPQKDTYELKFRLDGSLYKLADFPKSFQKSLESRIKIISKLKLNVDGVPQDGRFSFKAGDKDIDVRVSLLPSNYGYSIVMRLLGTGNVDLDLEKLGFMGLAHDLLLKEVEKPQGLILTTGPTGSGKTTTLYTVLSVLNNGENKIITLEDPIEYKVAGISQTQINTQGGYTFNAGLRSILRQDPDIVMVGEIRDGETAEIAIEASMTGHKVLSTLHTNDASGTLPRLMEMGIKGFLLADSLSLVIGQRLIRKLCPDCKIKHTLSSEEAEFVRENMRNISPKARLNIPAVIQFYTATGCVTCNNLGYKGRIGAYEVLHMNDEIKNLVSTREPSIVEVRKIATETGMVTMLQDAIYKAMLGITDIKEVRKKIM